ncbi:MAG: cytochrome c [Proteobacteria bacterium]|nr:cytochrome c [Pseudomonadota bacterium]
MIGTFAVILAGSAVAVSGSAAAAAEVELTDDFLNNPDNIAAGRQLFGKQCARCHGSKAYPGKAPKLKEKIYKPEFVYKRITKGFRGMPSWKNRYNEEQRKSITAYVVSKDFTN